MPRGPAGYELLNGAEPHIADTQVRRFIALDEGASQLPFLIVPLNFSTFGKDSFLEMTMFKVNYAATAKVSGFDYFIAETEKEALAQAQEDLRKRDPDVSPWKVDAIISTSGKPDFEITGVTKSKSLRAAPRKKYTRVKMG